MAVTPRSRCAWAGDDPLYVAYHDREWGVPLHDDRRLFELLTLEGAQAGLAWITILRKREGYRAAFDGFDPEKIARYGKRKIESLLRIRSRSRDQTRWIAAVSSSRLRSERMAAQ